MRVLTKCLYFVEQGVCTGQCNHLSGSCLSEFLHAFDRCLCDWADVSSDAMAVSRTPVGSNTMGPAFSCRCHWAHCFRVECLIVIPGDERGGTPGDMTVARAPLLPHRTRQRRTAKHLRSVTRQCRACIDSNPFRAPTTLESSPLRERVNSGVELIPRGGGGGGGK